MLLRTLTVRVVLESKRRVQMGLGLPDLHLAAFDTDITQSDIDACRARWQQLAGFSGFPSAQGLGGRWSKALEERQLFDVTHPVDLPGVCATRFGGGGSTPPGVYLHEHPRTHMHLLR